MTKGSYGTHVYFNEGQGRRTYINIYRQKYTPAIWEPYGETQQFPVLGKRLKCDRDLSENKLQDSVGTSARD